MSAAEMIQVWTDETVREEQGCAEHPAGDLDAELQQLFAFGAGSREPISILTHCPTQVFTLRVCCE
jgi:hypothetical protein